MFIILGIILAVVVIGFLIFFRIRKEVASDETLRYDNFGHNWNVEEVINAKLSKFKKPVGTLFEWEAKKDKPSDGSVDQIILTIKLKDLSNSDLVTWRKCSISHVYQNDICNSYEHFYSKNQDGYHFNREVSYTRQISVKEAILNKVSEHAESLIDEYIQKYPSGNMDNYKNGAV